MARFLVISSQVCSGYVGLSAMVPALHALGHEVIALPTILLSNHPGHTHAAGQQISPDDLADMLAALDSNGRLGAIDAIVTGYLPSPEHVAFACQAVARVATATARNGRSADLICDPVLGDHPKGLYIAETAACAIRDTLVPKARLLTPNVFELSWLTGLPVTSKAEAEVAARRLGAPGCVVTSVPTGRGLANLEVMARPPSSQASATVCVESPYLDQVPNGTGDLFTAVYTGFSHLDLDRDRSANDGPLAAASRHITHVCQTSRNRADLDLIAHLPALCTMMRRTKAMPDSQQDRGNGSAPTPTSPTVSDQ